MQIKTLGRPVTRPGGSTVANGRREVVRWCATKPTPPGATALECLEATRRLYRWRQLASGSDSPTLKSSPLHNPVPDFRTFQGISQILHQNSALGSAACHLPTRCVPLSSTSFVESHLINRIPLFDGSLVSVLVPHRIHRLLLSASPTSSLPVATQPLFWKSLRPHASDSLAIILPCLIIPLLIGRGPSELGSRLSSPPRVTIPHYSDSHSTHIPPPSSP